MAEIHSTAIVDPKAELAQDVKIGPYCILGPDVKVGSKTIIDSHCVIDGVTTIGEENHIRPYCRIGAPPQDVSYKDEPTRLEIGHKNQIREYVSIHRATTKENHLTQVGNENLIMAYCHLGHDVVLGHKCIIANAVQFAGHVKMADEVIVGGGAAFNQFVKIGKGAFIGGHTGLDKDLPPYTIGIGNRCRIKGANLIGLKRRKVDRKSLSLVMKFFDGLKHSGAARDYAEHSEYREDPVVEEIIQFILASERGIPGFVTDKGGSHG